MKRGKSEIRNPKGKVEVGCADEKSPLTLALCPEYGGEGRQLAYSKKGRVINHNTQSQTSIGRRRSPLAPGRGRGAGVRGRFDEAG
jgi:hypothetical protein